MSFPRLAPVSKLREIEHRILCLALYLGFGVLFFSLHFGILERGTSFPFKNLVGVHGPLYRGLIKRSSAFYQGHPR